MSNFDPVTGEPLTPEAKAARAAQEPTPDYRQPNIQPVYQQQVLPQMAPQQPSYYQQPQSEEDLLKVSRTSAPKAKKLPKGLLIGGIVGGVAVLAAIVLLVSSLFGGSPVKRLVTGVEKTAKAMSATGVGETVQQVIKSGSVTLSVDLSKNDELVPLITGSNMDLDAQAELALYFKEYGAALSLDSKLNGSALADALIVLTKDDLAVSSTALFSKTNYGINLKNMAKNLKGSIFDPEEGTEYAMPESMFEALAGEKRLDLDQIEKLAKEGKAIAKDFLDELIDSVNKNAEVTKGSEKITIGDKEVSTSTVTVELDAKAIKGIASDMLDYLRKDKDIKNFLTKVQTMAEDGAFGSFLQLGENFVEDFYDELDDAKDSLDDLEEQLEKTTITVTVYLKGSQLVQLQVDEKINKEKATVRLTIGPDPKAPEEFTYYQKGFDGDKFTISCKVTTNDKNAYESTVTVKEDTETVAKVKIAWDKKEGDLKISGEYSGYSYYSGKYTDTFELKANMTQSGKKTVIELQKFTLTEDGHENSVSLKGITLTFDGGAKFPDISKYTDVLTLDVDEFENLLEDVQKAFQDLTQSAMQELK